MKRWDRPTRRQEEDEMPENMTTAEVAELCRVSEVTVRWWRHVGRGRAPW